MDLLTGPMMTVLTGVCSLGLESCCGSKRYCVLSGDVWMELKTIRLKMGLNNDGLFGVWSYPSGSPRGLAMDSRRRIIGKEPSIPGWTLCDVYKDAAFEGQLFTYSGAS